MTSDEMIAEFLAKNKPTACPDNHRISTGKTRKSNVTGGSLSKSLFQRTAKTFTCEDCKKPNCLVVKPTLLKPNNGNVDHVYMGDKICSTCRYKRKEKIRNEKVKLNKVLARYGSEETYILAQPLNAITVPELKASTLKNLTIFLKNAEFVQANSTIINQTIQHKIEVATNLIKSKQYKLETITDDDWDELPRWQQEIN